MGSEGLPKTIEDVRTQLSGYCEDIYQKGLNHTYEVKKPHPTTLSLNDWGADTFAINLNFSKKAYDDVRHIMSKEITDYTNLGIPMPDYLLAWKTHIEEYRPPSIADQHNGNRNRA